MLTTIIYRPEKLEERTISNNNKNIKYVAIISKAWWYQNKAGGNIYNYLENSYA